MISKTITCISCPVGCRLNVSKQDGNIEVKGNTCARGVTYGKQEFTAPVRIVTTSVRVEGGARPVVSVKTEKPVDKAKIPDVLSALRGLRFFAPCRMGDVALHNAGDSGINVVFTSTVLAKD